MNGVIRMMEISLIRHGKSKHTDKQLVTANEFKVWVEHYDSSVVEELEYPAETLMVTSNRWLLH